MRKFTLVFAVLLTSLVMSSCVVYEMIVYSNKDIVISNPCEGEIQGVDFKLKSLVGDKDTQRIILTGYVINHDINKSIPVGKNLIAYDNEGQAHPANSSAKSYELRTDKKVKFTLEIPGQYVPKRNKKLPVVSFDVDECHIEVRNVPVIWRKFKKEN